MIEEIKKDNNCIVKAFENNPISILQENIDNKKVYYFKASDIGKALQLSNIAVSIQNYDEDERVIRKAYDTTNREQKTTFLTSQGVYRLLYNSKKETAKKFRKWAGNILDDIIFNESKELTKQLKEFELQLNNQKQITVNSVKDTLLYSYDLKNVVYLIKIKDTLYKYGFSDDIQNRFKSHIREIGKDIQLIYCIESKNNVLLEKHLKKYLEESNIKINQIINTKNQTELFEINDIQTIINILELYNKDINQDKEKIKNDGLLLEVEKLHLNLDIIFQENYKIKNDTLLSENEKLKQELDNFKTIKLIIPEIKIIVEETEIIVEEKENVEKKIRKYYPRTQASKDREKIKSQTPEFKAKESERNRLKNNTPEAIEKRAIYNRLRADTFNKKRRNDRKLNPDLNTKSVFVRSDVEKQRFLQWLKVNIIKSQGDLIWSTVLMKYLNVKTSPLISSIYKQHFEEYVIKSYNFNIVYISKLHGYHLFSLI